LLLWTSVAACACRPVIAPSDPSEGLGIDAGEARHPDGVVVESLPAIPGAVERAEARGVVALHEPIGPERVREVVLAISDAWRHGSLDALRDLLTADAVELDSPKGGRTVLLDRWKERLRAFSVDHVPGGSLFALDRLAHCSYDDMSVHGTPPRPAPMRPGDVYVWVPFEVTQLGSDRVFGEMLVLVLRREGEQIRVAGYGEMAEP
jgi:hypothetical protein